MSWTDIRRAVVSLLLVGMGYGLYSVFVVPWVEPAALAQEPLEAQEAIADSTSSTDRFVQELTPLFPEGAWELNHPKVLQTQQARVLFQEFKQLQDGSLQVRPCTLVLFGNPDKPAQGGPTILQAPEGAILAFEEPLDLLNGSFGKPIGGQLVGAIRIFHTGGPDMDDLVIKTSNVHISNQRIFTLDPVSFRYGKILGEVRELELTRADPDAVYDPELESEDAGSDKLIDELGMIQLQQVDRLTVRLEQDDMFRSLTSLNPTGSDTEEKPSKPSTVQISSRGPLRFDLKALKATIEKNVRVTRQADGELADTIYATRLWLQLARTQKKPAIGTANPDTEIALTHVNAVGNPLIVDAKSQQVYFECGELDYNLLDGQVKLLGPNPSSLSGDDGGIRPTVRVRGAGFEISAPTLRLANHEDPALRQIFADGAGQFVGAFKGKHQIKASWSRGLALVPARDRQQQMRIEGDAVVHAPGAGAISAESIQLWLAQKQEQVATRLNGQPIFETKSVPIRMVTQSAANGFTQVDAQKFRGSLANMEILFQRNPVPRRAEARQGQAAAQEQASDDRGRFRIDGGSLRAWVDIDSQDVYRVHVLGQSRIKEEAADGRPFSLEGTEIDLSLDGEIPVAMVRGRPAKLTSADLDAIGNTIEFDGHRNTVQIPGAGTFKVQASSSLWGSPIPVGNRANRDRRRVKPQPIDIDWNRSLEFDGSFITVAGDVRAVGKDLSFAAGEVTIQLDRPVDLSKLNDNQAGPRPELKHLAARGRVESSWKSRDEAGQLEAIQHVVSRDLEVDFSTNEVLASGPGVLSLTSKDNPLSESMSLAGSENRPAVRQDESSQLQHLSLAFAHRLEANLERREAHVWDNIHMWFGPVADWETRVEPSRVDRSQLRKDDVWMSCYELFVLESPTGRLPNSKRKPFEMLARGDAYVEGQLYAAKGHQVKFAEDKKMLTFEGDEQRPAELWQRTRVGEKSTRSGQVRRIRYWLDSKEAKLEGIIGVDVSGKLSERK